MVASSLTVFLSGALYYYQNELIYPRNIPPNARTEVPRPNQFGIDGYDEHTLLTPDGEKLHSFLIRPGNPSQARPITILMFHGNAGNIGHRLPIARVLANDLHCNVFMLQYRGYGLSTGNPDEAGLTIDAQTALDWIKQSELADTKLVIYGQSLGGAVGIGLAARNRGKAVAAMVLENTFLSIRKMIPK